MKKILTMTASGIIAFSVTHAQIKKDAVLIGGGITVYSSKNNGNPNPADTKFNITTFSLSAGKAVKENTVVGLYGGYGQSKSENFYSGSNKTTTTVTNSNAGVFYRKYKPLGKGFYFLGEVNAGYTGFKQEYTTSIPANNTRYTSNGADLGLTPGLSYQLFKKLQLEVIMPSFAGVEYATSKTTTISGTVKGNAFQFSTSLNNGTLLSNLSLGFRLVL